MGEVGLEPTKAKPADLQSAPFAARDTPPIRRPEAADENASGCPRRDRLAYLARRPALSTVKCRRLCARAARWAIAAPRRSTLISGIRRDSQDPSTRRRFRPGRIAPRAARGKRPSPLRAPEAARGEPRQSAPRAPRRQRAILRRRAHLRLSQRAAALRAPRRKLVRLYATAAAAERLADEIAARGVETRILEPDEIALRAPRDAVHQGLLLEARPLEPIDISRVPADGLVVALDQVTDPHNFGAILRTCAAFAVDALVTTERHSPDLTGALAKSASGGLEHVPICSGRQSGARARRSRRSRLLARRTGFGGAADACATARLDRPLALVLGAEDKGLRRLTRERCDVMARLDLPGAIQSLNVSNACAIALAIASGKSSQPA